MVRRGRHRSRLEEVFFGNWRNKSTALILALVIWGLTFGTTLTESTIKVQVSVEPPSEDVVIVEMFVEESEKTVVPVAATPFTGEVELTIRGQRHSVDELWREYQGLFTAPPDHVIDLLQTKNYDLPQGIEVVDAKPFRIRVRTEGLKTVSVPVKIEAQGTPDDPSRAFDRTKSTADPSSVELVMPESYEGQVTCRTEPVDLGPLASATRVRLGILIDVQDGLDASLVQLAPGSEQTVEAFIDFTDARRERTLDVKVRFVIAQNVALKIIDTKDEIPLMCKGTPQQLDVWEENVKADACVVNIRVASLTDEPQQINFRLVDTGRFYYWGLPEGVEAVDWGGTLTYKTVRLDDPK